MKLDGEGIVPNRVNSVETRAVRGTTAALPGRKAADSAGPAASGSGTRAAVDVQITGTARDLAAIEQGLRSLPAVNEARVAAVRQKLEDGSYRVDPQRIADRLLDLEQDLGRANPVNDRTLR